MKKDFDFISNFAYVIFEIRYGSENFSVPDPEVCFNGKPDKKLIEHLENYYDDDVIVDMIQNAEMFVYDFVNDGEDLIWINVNSFPEDKFEDIFYFEKLYIRVIKQ